MDDDAVGQYWRRLEVGVRADVALAAYGAPPDGIPVELGDLALITGPIRPGDVWAVLGCPGLGVSTLALQIAAAAAVRHGRTAAVVCNHLPIAVQLARLTAFPRWAARLADAPLYLATGLPGFVEVPTEAVRLPSGGQRPDLLVVDTIDEEFRADDLGRRERRRGPRRLVDTCRKSGVALLMSERLASPRQSTPSLFDLADVVLQLTAHEGMYGEEETRLTVVKNRWGPRGPVDGVLAQFQFGRFATLAKKHDHESGLRQNRASATHDHGQAGSQLS